MNSKPLNDLLDHPCWLKVGNRYLYAIITDIDNEFVKLDTCVSFGVIKKPLISQSIDWDLLTTNLSDNIETQIDKQCKP